MAYTLVPTELIVDGAVTSAKLDTNISISGTLGVTGELTLSTHMNMGDNDKIKIGTGGDLEIYHDGSNSYISNSTGNIYLADTNGSVHIQAKLNEESIVCAADGAVSLYYDNAVKLATSSAGVDITGKLEIAATGTNAAPHIKLVESGDTREFNIYNDGSGNGRLVLADTDDTPDSEIVLADNGVLQFKTANSEAMTIDSSQRVGIGTSSPSTALEVNNASAGATVATFEGTYSGSGDVKLASFERNGGAVAAAIEYNDATTDMELGTTTSHNFSLKTADTRRLTIDSSGNVGIGASPSYPFHVTGSGDTVAAVTAGASSVAALNLGNSTNLADGGIRYDNSADALIFRASNAEKMRINSSGRVGIGITSPTGSLHITNKDDGGSDVNVHIQNTTANRLAGLKLLDENGTVHGVFRYDNGGNNASLGVGTGSPSAPLHVVGNAVITGNIISTGDTNIIYDSDDDCIFSRANGNETMRLDSGGAMHIGTTAQAGGGWDAHLNVAHDANAAYFRSTGSGGSASVGIQTGTYTSTTYALVFYNGQQGGAGGVSLANGNASTSVTYNTSSDYRMKENIRPLENGLDRLKQLKPVKFDWKTNDETSEGFIAHEVQEIFPDAIAGEKDGEEMQGMDYGRITPLLVEAIQEQQTIIEDLKSRIETLEG